MEHGVERMMNSKEREAQVARGKNQRASRGEKGFSRGGIIIRPSGNVSS
jgi:hypothetical protein